MGQVTLVALLGCAALVTAPSLTVVWRRALQRVGVGGAGLGVATVGTTALLAEFGPLSWLQSAWTSDLGADATATFVGPDTVTEAAPGWCAVAILLAVAATGLIARRGQPREERAYSSHFVGACAGVLALVGLAAAPIAAGASARVALAAALLEVVALVAAGSVTSRRQSDAGWTVGALACVPLVPAVGWAAMTETASIAGLVVVAVVAGAATAYARQDLLRALDATLSASAVALLAAVIVLAADGSVAAGAFAGAATAGIVLALGAMSQ